MERNWKVLQEIRKYTQMTGNVLCQIAIFPTGFSIRIKNNKKYINTSLSNSLEKYISGQVTSIPKLCQKDEKYVFYFTFIG